MNIFESLENLQVSEECFNDIIEVVEKLLLEDEFTERLNNSKIYNQNRNKAIENVQKLDKIASPQDRLKAEIFMKHGKKLPQDLANKMDSHFKEARKNAKSGDFETKYNRKEDEIDSKYHPAD